MMGREKSEHESSLSYDYKNEGRHCTWQFLKQMEVHKGRLTKKDRKISLNPFIESTRTEVKNHQCFAPLTMA